jgi:DNA-binding GntR family transcriptional regulator
LTLNFYNGYNKPKNMESYVLLHTSAYEYLMNGLMSGLFQPGQFYSENKLVKEIGISRTPIRSALQQLKQNRLIEIIPNKGFTLYKMSSHKDIIENYQIRAAIEGYALSQLLKDKTEKSREKIRELKEIHDRLASCYEEPLDRPRFAAIDEEFHKSLVGYLENSSFNELLFCQIFRTYILLKIAKMPNRDKEALAEHTALMNAILTGDEKETHAALMNHLDNIVNYLRSHAGSKLKF